MERKRAFLITVITVFIILYIKIIFGTININSHFEFQGPSYNVTVNDKLISSHVFSTKKIKVIPFLVDYNSEHGVTTKGDEECKIKLGSQVLIDISPFRCYSTVMGSKEVAKCSYDNSHMILEDIEENEYTFDSMDITGGATYALTHNKIYKGKFKEDITDLLKNNARYQVIVNVRYKNILSEIYIIIDIV